MFNLSDKFHFRLGLIVTIVAVLLLVSGGLFYFFIFSEKDKIQSREFAGGVEKIENNLLYVSGTFVSPEHPELGKDRRNVIVDINARTKFERTILYLPSNKELEKAGGVFYSQDLERKVEEVSFDQLVEDYNNEETDYIGGVTVYVKTKANIYGLDKFRASKIEYIVAAKPIKRQKQQE